MKLPQKILAKILLPPKILESKISNPKKSFNHPCHLKSGVPPPPSDFQLILKLLRYMYHKEDLKCHFM